MRYKKKYEELLDTVSNLAVRVTFLEGAVKEFEEINGVYEKRIETLSNHIIEINKSLDDKKDEFDKEKMIEESIRQGIDNIFGYSVSSGITMPDGARK